MQLITAWRPLAQHVTTRQVISYKDGVLWWHYQLQAGDNPECPIQFIVMGDGNTSLSRMHHHFEGDLWHFNSNYFLPWKQVDKFSNIRKGTQHETEVRMSFVGTFFIQQHPLTVRAFICIHNWWLPGVEECSANGIKVKVGGNAAHGRDWYLFSHLSSWDHAVPYWYGRKWGAVSTLMQHVSFLTCSNTP